MAKNNPLVLITTYGRGPTMQKTWDNLPPAVLKRTSLVVAKSEERAFDNAGFRTLVCPRQGGPGGLGPVRQWCLEWAHRNGFNKLALLDDDLIQWSRRGMTTTGDTYAKCGPDEVGEAFKRMWKHLDDYAHGAIAISLFSQDRPEVEHNKRALDALFYRVDVLINGGYKFDMRTMSDFDMTLKLFKAGYANVIDRYVYQKQMGSNKAGGCSSYRDLAEMERTANELKRRYPEFVTVVDRPGDSWGYDGARKDVKIAWARMAKFYNARTIGEH